MTDLEVRRLFESALEHPAPDSTDIDEAIRMGSRRRSRRRATAASMASAAGVVAVVLGVTATGALTQPDRPTPLASGQSPVPSLSASQPVQDVAAQTAENRRLAKAASGAALAGIVLPEGAVRLDGKPAGWPETYMSLGPSDWKLTVTGWWSVPSPQSEVAAFFKAHAPSGMRHPIGEMAIDEGGSDGIASTEYEFVRPENPAAYAGPSLLVQFRQIGDRTVIRADTFLAARMAVSDQHRISDQVVAVEIERIGRKPGTNALKNIQLPTIRLSAANDSATINQLVTTFNALYGSVDAGSPSCPYPGDPPPRNTVTFHTKSAQDGSTGTVVADVHPSCFGQVSVTVNGVRLEGTLDPEPWGRALSELVGAAGSAPTSSPAVS